MTTPLVRRANYSKISCDCEVVINNCFDKNHAGESSANDYFFDGQSCDMITHQKHSMKMTKKITRQLWKKIGLSPWRKLMNQIRGKWDNENDTNV
jgi:hypothetical protein